MTQGRAGVWLQDLISTVHCISTGTRLDEWKAEAITAAEARDETQRVLASLPC